MYFRSKRSVAFRGLLRNAAGTLSTIAFIAIVSTAIGWMVSRIAHIAGVGAGLGFLSALVWGAIMFLTDGSILVMQRLLSIPNLVEMKFVFPLNTTIIGKEMILSNLLKLPFVLDADIKTGEVGPPMATIVVDNGACHAVTAARVSQLLEQVCEGKNVTLEYPLWTLAEKERFLREKQERKEEREASEKVTQ